MKKLLSILLLPLLLLTCEDAQPPAAIEDSNGRLGKLKLIARRNNTDPPPLNTAIRDVNDEWQMANLGDLAFITVKPGTSANHHVFEFEGLEIPNDDNVRKHIALNTASYRADLTWYRNLAISDDDDDPSVLDWYWFWDMDENERWVYERRSTYDLNVELDTEEGLFEETDTVYAYAIELIYCPTSDQPTTTADRTFYYTYKGYGSPNFVDGGLLELVGIKVIENKNIVEYIGDYNFSTSIFMYKPTGYYSKTPADSAY